MTDKDIHEAVQICRDLVQAFHNLNTAWPKEPNSGKMATLEGLTARANSMLMGAGL